MTCISVVPLATTIVRDLSPPSLDDPANLKSSSILLVTIWELGEAAGPLLIAPLSELHGRYAVTNTANLCFIAACVVAATSTTVPQFVVARMLNGLAVAGNVLNPAIVGDIFAPEERGGALSLLFLASLVGGAFGPMIGSAVAERWGWRAVVWMAVAVAAGCEALFLTCFRETYKVAILRRRAKKLAREAAVGEGRRFKTAFDELETAGVGGGVERRSEWRKLRDAVMRPAMVLFGSGVLMAMSLFSSVVFTFFYIYSTTFSDILLDLYKLSPVTVGSCFTVFCKMRPLFEPQLCGTCLLTRRSRWLNHQRGHLQSVPRPHLHPDALHAQGRRQTRVPTPACDNRRFRSAVDRGGVRLGCRASTAAPGPAVLRVCHGDGADASHDPGHGLRR